MSKPTTLTLERARAVAAAVFFFGALLAWTHASSSRADESPAQAETYDAQAQLAFKRGDTAAAIHSCACERSANANQLH